MDPEGVNVIKRKKSRVSVAIFISNPVEASLRALFLTNPWIHKNNDEKKDRHTITNNIKVMQLIVKGINNKDKQRIIRDKIKPALPVSVFFRRLFLA
jgi:hypothetical protein